MGVTRNVSAGTSASASTFLSTYFRETALRGPALALRNLVDRLRAATPSIWADCVRQLVSYEPHQGVLLLESGLRLHPANAELLCLQGAASMRAGDRPAAETAYRRALAAVPDHEEAAFGYARLLRDSGRMKAAAATLMQMSRQAALEDNLISTVEFLVACGQRADAYALCMAKLASQRNAPALQFEAGTLALTLGKFTAAEAHLRAALYGQPPEWGATLPLAMCRRYDDAADPDLMLFRGIWTDTAVPESQRLVAGFALGKVLDDLGDYAEAASTLRAANALARAEQPWSRRNWDDFIDVQLSLEPAPLPRPMIDDIVPVFIIGMPRTGTTLVAELLARHPEVCNRGELNWISFLAEQLAIVQGFHDRNALAQAALQYLQQLRQDDAPVRYYIDKNPLNFRHLGLIAALFPNARIIHCCRDPRDTALSIWSQLFDHAENAYAYGFDTISAVMRGHDRLFEGLVPRLRLPVHRVQYEDLVTRPDAVLAGLAEFTGLGPDARLMALPPKAGRPIGTASVWQARQPIYARGVGRFRHYLPHVPELAALSSGEAAGIEPLPTFRPVQPA